MSNIIEAEYKVVQERTLPVIASEILEIESNVCRVALDGAIRIGEKLKEAKEKVDHGQWENWCRENLNYSKSKTEKLMKIATEYGDPESLYAKTYTCTDLSISKALRLLQVPEEEVESFAESHDIESMTVKELEDEIKSLKEQIDTVDTENDRFREDIRQYRAEIEELKAAGADPARITDLESKLEKQKEKTRKLQDEIKAEKDAKDQAVADAVEKEKTDLLEQAEKAAEDKLLAAQQENEALSGKVEQLERKLQNSSRENTLIFKLRVDQLQEVYSDCMRCIDAEEDREQEEKMRKALDKVMDSLHKTLRDGENQNRK